MGSSGEKVGYNLLLIVAFTTNLRILDQFSIMMMITLYYFVRQKEGAQIEEEEEAGDRRKGVKAFSNRFSKSKKSY